MILPGLPGGAEFRPSKRPKLVGAEQSDRFGPLNESERGVILWAGIQVDPSGRTMSGMPLDPQELRSALLLWDRLDWPANDFLSRASGADEEFLVSEGILRRSQFSTQGVTELSKVVESNVVALEHAELREPGQWSLSRGANTASPIVDPALHDRSLLVRLIECIPVPHGEVPLAEILEFKGKRKDELQNLRHHIERIYQSILAAPDRAMAEATELNALDRAIAAHVRSIKEASFKKALGSLEASLDLPTVGGAAMAGALAFQAGMPITSALISGAGAFSLSLGLGRLRSTQGKNPFEYVTMAHKEL